MITLILLVYLYFIGAWALSEAEFSDEEGNPPDELNKTTFCVLWPLLVPIWIVRNRMKGE